MDASIIAAVAAGGLACAACDPTPRIPRRLLVAGAVGAGLVGVAGHPFMTAALVIVGVMASHAIRRRTQEAPPATPEADSVVEAEAPAAPTLREQAVAALAALKKTPGVPTADIALVRGALADAESARDSEMAAAGYRQVCQIAGAATARAGSASS